MQNAVEFGQAFAHGGGRGAQAQGGNARQEGVRHAGVLAQGEGFAGAGHGDVVQAAFVVAVSLPFAVVEQNDVVKFQPFGAVGGQQQHGALHARVDVFFAGTKFVEAFDDLVDEAFAARGAVLKRDDKAGQRGALRVFDVAFYLRTIAAAKPARERGGAQQAAAARVAAMRAAQQREQGGTFAGGVQRRGELFFVEQAHGHVAQATQDVERGKVLPLPGDDGKAAPRRGIVGVGQGVQAFDFGQYELRGKVGICGQFQQVHAPAGDGVVRAKCAACGVVFAQVVDADGFVCLHAPGGGGDEGVGGGDDVGGGAVVFHQQGALGVVVRLKAADEAHVGVVEGVDVLVVVANGENAQAVLFAGQRFAGKGADEFVGGVVDVLIFVDEQIAAARQRAVAAQGEDFAVFVARFGGLLQQGGGARDDFVELDFFAVFVGGGEAGAGDAQRQRVYGLDDDADGIHANQRPKPPTHFQRGGSVVGEHHDFFGRHQTLAQQPGNSMHDDAGFAAARAGKDELVLRRVGGDDGFLRGVFEIQQDAAVRFFAGCQREQVFALAREIAAGKLCRIQFEIVFHQTQGGLHLLQGKPGVFAHYVHLGDFAVVIEFQRQEVFLVEQAAAFGGKFDGHGRAENRLAARQMQHFVGVQVNEAGVENALPVAKFVRLQLHVVAQRSFQFAAFGGDQQVVTLAAARKFRHQRAAEGQTAAAEVFNLRPAAQHANVAFIRTARAHFDERGVAAVARVVVIKGFGEGFEQAGEGVGAEILLAGVVAYLMAELAQVERLPVVAVGIRGVFAHVF